VPTKDASETAAKSTAEAIPFVRAAHKLRNPGNQFVSAAMGAAAQDFGPFDVPSGGFLRNILVEVEALAGTNGAAALAYNADAPWNALRSVELSDVNGRPIFYPNLTGYDLYLINKYGAYRYWSEPEDSPNYYLEAAGAGADGEFTFSLRIPVEIDSTDAYGALPNLNSAEPYRTRFTIAPSADVYSTPPDTTISTVTVRQVVDNWSLPATKDSSGNVQTTEPPDMNTTQNWSKTVFPIVAGANTIKLARTGNLLRELILVYRAVGGARITLASGNYPNDLSITWDRYQLIRERAVSRLHTMNEDFGNIVHPAGVYVYHFTEDGSVPGNEKRNLWIPTLQPTEILFEGTFGVAGTLEVITNDIMPHGGR
jgi:hypothetical protein